MITGMQRLMEISKVLPNSLKKNANKITKKGGQCCDCRLKWDPWSDIDSDKECHKVLKWPWDQSLCNQDNY